MPFKSYLYSKILSLRATQHAYFKVKNTTKYYHYMLFKKLVISLFFR